MQTAPPSEPDLKRFRALLDASSEAIYIADVELGRFVDLNEAACRMLGYDRAELLQLAPNELRPPELRGPPEQFREQVGLLRSQGPFSVTTLHQRRDGTSLPVEVRVSLHRFEGRECVLGICRELTEQSAAEQRLRMNDHLTTLGNLSAGIAHEFNNPLTYLSANVDFVRAEIGSDDRDALLEALDEAAEGASRLRRIIRELSSFAESGRGAASHVPIHRALRAAARLAQASFGPTVRLVQRLEDVPDVFCDESRLVRVFVNLLVNAAHALESAPTAESTITVSSKLSETGRVVVTVEDEGPGIPDDVLPKIFQPFYTTKPTGQGSGLGLSICHRVVTQMGGRITVEGRQGLGARFHVELPIAAGAAPVRRAAHRAGDESAGHHASVLVIDDDRLAARALKRILHRHDVIVVSGGTEALERLEERAFDVVLCDLMMPEITGMELYERVLEMSPEQAERMVFLTGGAFTDAASSFVKRHAERCYEKPVSAKLLRNLVASRAPAPRADCA